MGKRDVTLYACDGCGASSTVGLNEPPRGFTRVTVPSANLDKWLCTTCYGAVDWVIRFQGIIVPPKVYGSGRRYSLRKPVER